MFQPQFAPLVESGQKRQTVRPVPKRLPRAGQEISLRQWTGKPYRSPQRELRRSMLDDIQPITIHDDGITFTNEGAIYGTCKVTFRKMDSSDRLLNDFAKADGFSGWQEMRDWFARTHGLPFTGVLLKWA